MNSKQFQFNCRSVISAVLAGLLLALTAIPALAWEDMGGPDFRAVRPCQITVRGEEGPIASCGRAVARPSSLVVSDRSIAPMGVIRAEEAFLRGWQSAQLMAKADHEE
jgi:hypothetical protein